LAALGVPGHVRHITGDFAYLEDPSMKATLGRHVIAESDDITECAGYKYFPAAVVRQEWLEKTPRTASDLECPHSVQFYDVIIDGQRHKRAAWAYEAPRPSIDAQVRDRFGFWHEVTVG
jgi:uncharacterized protein (DUF427 family)